MAQKNAGKIDFMSDYQTEKEKKLKKEILKSQQESAKIKLQTGKSTAPKTDSDIIQEYESIPEYNILQRGFSGNTTRGTGRPKTTEASAYEKKQSLYPEYRQAKNRQIGKFLSENGIGDDALDKAFAKDRSTLNTSVKTNLSIPVGVTSGYIDLKRIADKADLSMDDLQDYYNAKKSGEFVDKAVDFADEHGVLGTGASVATNLLGTAATVPTETVNYLTGKPIGSNEEINNYGRVTGEMRGAVKENISNSIENPVLDKIANFGYDVGTSIGDMGTASIIGGGPAGALAIMSASAGANTLNEAKDRNLTPDQMMGTAIASGAIEALTEKIPLENLFDMIKRTGKSGFKQIAGKVFQESFEEFVGEGTSELANSFADNVINSDESEWNQSVNKYMLYGMTKSQAENQAKKDLAGRALQSALAGAISGGIMAGGAGVVANSKSDIITPEQFQANNEYIQKLKEINDGKSYLDIYNNRVEKVPDMRDLSTFKNVVSYDTQNNTDSYTKMLERVQNVQRTGSEDMESSNYVDSINKVINEINLTSSPDMGPLPTADNLISTNTGDSSSLFNNSIPNSGENVNEGSKNVQYNGKKIDGFDDLNRDLDRLIGMYKGNENTQNLYEQMKSALNEYVQTYNQDAIDRALTLASDIDGTLVGHSYTRKGSGKNSSKSQNNRVTTDFAEGEFVDTLLAYGKSLRNTARSNAESTSQSSVEIPFSSQHSYSEITEQSGENVNAGQRKRSYNETFVEKTDAPQELKNEFINNPDMYTALSNAETKAKADGILNGNNTDAALTEFRKLLDEKKPEAVPLGYSLSKKLYQEGRIDESVQLVRDMSRALTESGQFSQAAAITMLNNDPEAAKRYIIRELDTLNQNGREKYGKKWTDFELSEADLKKFDSIEPGDTDAIKAAYQSIYDRISKQYPSTMTEKLMEFRRISMLLNVRTNVRNVVSNALLYPVRWTADRISALGEGVYSLIDPKYQRTQSINPIRSQNAKKLASEAFDTVKSELLGDNKYEDSKGAIRDRQMFKGSKLSQMLDTVTNGAITKANQAMGKNVNPSLMETARNFTYWLLEKGDNVFVRKNFESRMASYIDAQGITDIESIPADAYTLATQEALKATFKDDSAFANGLSEFRKMLNQTPGHFLGDAVMPFTKTPANLAMRGMDYSPAGVLSGLITLTSAKSNADIAKGITQLGQAATGTAAIALGYALAGAGIITGSLSDDKDEAQFQKQQGQLAYSVKTPYGYFTYDWAQPASIPIILGVTIYDSRNNDGDFINGLKNGFLASVDSWLELSPLQNISDIFGGYGSPAENVWDVLSTDLPLSYLPAQLGAAARIGDTTQRVTYDQNSYFNNLMNQAKSKIPGLSETLPVAYDTWGNPIKRQDSTAESAFANLINPGQFGNSNVTPIDGEIIRLYDSTGDAGVFPRKASWSAKVGGENIKLDNKQYSEYQRIMGTDAFDMVSALIESQAYNSLSDEQRAEAISDMYSFSDALAKSEVLGYDVENSDTYKKTYSVYKEKGSEGVAVYLGIKQNQEGEKISDKFTAVDSIDLSDEDKGYYLSKLVDVSKDASEIQSSYGDAGLYTWYSLRSKADSDGNGNISNAEMVNQIIKTDMSYDDMLNYASVLYEDGKEKTAREKAVEAIQDAQRLNRIDSIINGHKSANSGNYQSNKSSLERIEEIINSRYSSDKVSNDDSLKRIQSIIDNRNARLLTPLN